MLRSRNNFQIGSFGTSFLSHYRLIFTLKSKVTTFLGVIVFSPILEFVVNFIVRNKIGI